MMDYYLKELPDNTFTLITREGQIIGKFDSPDEAQDIILDFVGLASTALIPGSHKLTACHSGA